MLCDDLMDRGKDQESKVIPTKEGFYTLAPVAGHPHAYLAFRAGPSRCGAIMDGISLAHWNCPDPQGFKDAEGGWVIAFADLEEMYLIAKAARATAETKDE